MIRDLHRSARRGGAMFLFVFLLAGARMVAGHAPTIVKLVVAQSLGNQSDRYVAGKDTAVLAVLADPISADPSTMNVTVTRDGTVVGQMLPWSTVTPLTSSTSPGYVMSFVCRDRASCGDWVAGNYTFQATIGDLRGAAVWRPRGGEFEL